MSIHPANYDLTSLRDATWLACYIAVHASASADDSTTTEEDTRGADADADAHRSITKEGTGTNEGGSASVDDTKQDDANVLRIKSHGQRGQSLQPIAAAPTAEPTSASAHVAALPSLPDPEGFRRALQVLRNRDRRATGALDEAATLDTYACSGGRHLQPIAGRGPRRWLKLSLIVDAVPSSALWHQPLHEFETLLRAQGVFRQVRRWGLGDSPAQLNQSRTGPAPLRPVAATHMHWWRHELLIIASDFTASKWRGAEFIQLLQRWAAAQPLLLLHMLPPRLWPRSAMDKADAQVSSHSPACATANLPATFTTPGQRPDAAAPALPLAAFEPHALASWTRVTMAQALARMPAIVLADAAAVPPSAAAIDDAATATQRVLLFRMVSSRLAYRLAQFFSVTAPLNFPVMRWVQRAVLPASDASHLAEFFLGALLARDGDATDPDRVRYEFLPGVREQLQQELPKDHALEILHLVGNYLQRHALPVGANRAAAIQTAVTAGWREHWTDAGDGDLRAFALVSSAFFARLFGPAEASVTVAPTEAESITLEPNGAEAAPQHDAARKLIPNIEAGPRYRTPPPVLLSAAASMAVVHVTNPVGAKVPSRVPRELPPRAEHYFGRGAERDRLAQRLRERRNTAIVGPGGIGKTALAAEALHSIGNAALEKLYPDGSLYLDLYATRANRDALWAQLANRIAGPSFLEQAPPQVRAEEACRGKHLLLIVKGCEEADGRDGRADLTELLSVIPAETVRLLLTRQARQTVPAESIPVREALAHDDAAKLLDALSGGHVSGNDRSRLLGLLAGHPLALTWAGNLLARDNEHPGALLRDWNAAVLPPLTDPTNNSHTLRWLYDRSARGLDADAKRTLAGAGLLAHAPIPLALLEVAIEGNNRSHRARTSLRTLVGAGLMRIEVALPDHWQFAHVLAYRYARDQAEAGGLLALALAEHLHETLAADCARVDQPEVRVRVARSLDHAAVLLHAPPLTDEAGWKLIANPLLYSWQQQLLARGRSDLAHYALDIVEGWMDRRPAHKSERPDWQREHGVLHNKRGNELALRGDLTGARARYEAGLAIAQRLAKADPGNTWRQKDLVVSFSKLGDVQSAQGDMPGAGTHYEAGLEIARRLAAAEPGNMEWQRDLSISFTKLGNVQSSQGDLSGARAQYEKGLAIAQRLVEIDPSNADRQRDLSIGFNQLGDVQSAQGDLSEAMARYKAGLSIAQRLVQTDPGNVYWQRDLSISLDKLGDIQTAQGDMAGARARFEAGLAITERLAEIDPGNTEWQRDLRVSFTKLGDVQLAQGDLPGAEVRYEAALGIAQRLAEADPGNTEWQRELSISFDNLGDVQSALGDLQRARTHYEAGLAITQLLAEVDSINTEWQRDLSVSYIKLGDVQSAQGDLTGAAARFEAGLAITQRLAEADPGNTQWQRDLSISFDKLGDVQSAQGDLPGAQARYETGLSITQRLAKIDPDNTEWQRDLSISFEKFGEVHAAQGNFLQAQACFETGLAIAQRLAEVTPGSAQRQRDLGISFGKLGRMHSAQGDLSGARARFEAWLVIAQRLAEADPGNAQWQRDLSYSQTQLATLCESVGDVSGALHYAQASLAIDVRLAALNPTTATFRRDVEVSQEQVERLSRQLSKGN